jgi:hypothetical protein
MFILVLGFLVLIAGILSMQLPALDSALKEQDNDQWQIIMTPSASNFIVSAGIIQLFCWVLDQAYLKSKKPDIQSLGAAAFAKATRAKYLMLSGVVLVLVGFGAALAGY